MVADRLMGHQTISAPEFETGRRRDALTASRRRRFVLIAVVFSVGVHVVAALLVVLLPRVLPREAPPRARGTVELLMVEQKGAAPSEAGHPEDRKPSPPVPPAKPAPKVGPAASAAPVAAAVTPPAEEAVPVAAEHPLTGKAEAQAEAQSPAKEAPEQAEAAPPPPAPPKSQEAPVFDLAGTESESNAIAMGAGVIPAMPDDRFRNRPPVYPVEAQIHDQYGTVAVMIHVGASGLPNGVDVLDSSGVPMLDEAALTAVAKWHFRPALKDGQAVPFDMPFRFIFERGGGR